MGQAILRVVRRCQASLDPGYWFLRSGRQHRPRSDLEVVAKDFATVFSDFGTAANVVMSKHGHSDSHGVKDGTKGAKAKTQPTV